MTESRITVNARIKPLADELMHLTGVNSLTNLFALLLTRYGHHLKYSWVIGVTSISPATEQQASIQPPSMQAFNYQLPSEPQPEALTPTVDPIIARLSAYIEDF